MYQKDIIQKNITLFDLTLRLSDLLCFALSVSIATYLRFDLWTPSLLQIKFSFINFIITYLIFMKLGIYHSWRGRSLFSECLKIINAVLISVLIIFSVYYLLKIGAEFSRIWMFYRICIFSILICSSRIFYRSLLHTLRKRGFNQKTACLITSGHIPERIYKHIKKHPETGFIINDIFTDSKNISQIPQKLIRGNISSFKKWIHVNNPDQIWIDIPIFRALEIEKILHYARFSTSDIVYIPDIKSERFINSSISDISNMPIVNIHSSPMSNNLNLVIKRLEDIILSLLILILISPLMLIIAVIIKMASPGPVIFKQKRHGFNNKIFFVYKFRSMKIHQEKEGLITQASKEDPRITFIGKFIRKTSIDELPQFFNVLQGRMSIVGPRPHAIEHNFHYRDYVFSYMKRHKLKPGITGWAQINGLRGETDTVDKMEARVKYDLYYLEHWSLWFDLKIIFLTIFKGFFNKNAY